MTRFDLWSRYVAKTTQPILVGPWRSEVGFETLYWLPWLRQWMHTYKIPASRLIAISRGGASHWYGLGKAVELSDYWPAEAARLESYKDSKIRGSVKQMAITPLERALYPTIAARLGLRRYHVLHPEAMYNSLQGWWHEEMGLKGVMDSLRFAPIPTPHLPLTVALPEKFVCVRFYERYTWPFTDEVKDYCGQLIGSIAKHTPVVVIGSTVHHDDHMDLNFAGPNVLSLVDAFPEREHLAMQSAVMAKSSVFVGTYGGTMQLAVRLGKPSVGLYLKWSGTAFAHRTLTEWLATQQGTPLFIGTPHEGDLVRSVISAQLELPQPASSSSGATI